MANAAVSSCLTWIQSMSGLRRIASTTGLRLSPTTPYRRLTPARARMSTNCSDTFCLAMGAHSLCLCSWHVRLS